MAKATQAQEIRMAKLVMQWQEAAIARLDAEFPNGPRSSVVMTSYSVGGKFFHLVIGSSSAFLVDIVTGTIYGNKGWLKVDYKKIIGNAYDPAFDVKALIRDRFRYGHFENAADGSLLQPIVRR